MCPKCSNGAMLSINYADTTLGDLTESTSILHTLKPRILTKACYLSKIVGGSEFLAKNRVLQRSAYISITEARITITEV